MPDTYSDEYLTRFCTIEKNSDDGKYITETASCIYRSIYFSPERKYPKDGKENVIGMLIDRLIEVYHRGHLTGFNEGVFDKSKNDIKKTQ